MSSEDRAVEYLTPLEEDKVSRQLLIWLNTFPDIPVDVASIQYENLDADKPGMALSTIQGTYIVERNIIGGYTAEYQFKLIYRLKPGRSMDTRLKADEILDRLGDWASAQRPDIGEGLRVQGMEQTTRSSLFAALKDGWEDHQIFMRMTYQVKPRR